MKLSRYEILSNENSIYYEFVSCGPKGKIRKGVQFTLVRDVPKIYNLALGDVDNDVEGLDDSIRTNNGDRDMVFGTIGAIVMDFCQKNRDAYVLAEGNTPVRKRAYQIQISCNLDEINQLFTIWGNCNGDWELFRRDRKYDAMMAKLGKNF